MYRENLAERWDVSPPFRRLVRDVGRILASSGLLMVSIEVALIIVTPVDVFFGASWLILWAWAALSACYCISYTKKCLREEKVWWNVVSLGSSTERLLSEQELATQ